MTITKQQMMDYLPRYYLDSLIVNNLMQVESAEFDNLGTDLQEVLNQMYVDTATWGLSTWEKLFGLPDGSAKTYEERRAFIKSSIRGSGSVTKALIESVAEAYDGGDITVTEQPGSYQFTVTFIGTTGIPTNIQDTMAAIEAIKPAHLAVVYEYNYFLFFELDALNKTFIQFDALDLTFDELEVYS